MSESKLAAISATEDQTKRWGVTGILEYHFWCPGCQIGHGFRVQKIGPHDAHPVWNFDGNTKSPTFSPSLLVLPYPGDKDGKGRVLRCHLFLKAGKIQFLGDCEHGLKGKTVPLEVWPEDA